MSENKRVISISSTEMETMLPDLIPDVIYEYRKMNKVELVNKIWEARVEILRLRNAENLLDKELIQEENMKRDVYTLSNELFKLNQIIEDLNKAAAAAQKKNTGEKDGRKSKNNKA